MILPQISPPTYPRRRFPLRVYVLLLGIPLLLLGTQVVGMLDGTDLVEGGCAGLTAIFILHNFCWLLECHLLAAYGNKSSATSSEKV